MTVANVAFESSFSCGATILVTHSPKQIVQHADNNGEIGESIVSSHNNTLYDYYANVLFDTECISSVK